MRAHSVVQAPDGKTHSRSPGPMPFGTSRIQISTCAEDTNVPLCTVGLSQNVKATDLLRHVPLRWYTLISHVRSLCCQLRTMKTAAVRGARRERGRILAPRNLACCVIRAWYFMSKDLIQGD